MHGQIWDLVSVYSGPMFLTLKKSWKIGLEVESEWLKGVILHAIILYLKK